VRRLFRPEVAFFLLVWLGLAIVFRTRAFNDPGALWHVKVGERILENGFMYTDPFTYPFAGQTWIPQQWGGEIVMALAHHFGQFDTMLLGFAVGLAGLFTWVFSRAVRNGLHPVLAGLVVGGALVVSSFHFYARPHLFTIAGMIVTMVALVDYERGRASAWRLWCLIPFFVLWTNIHGGVLGGVATFGLAVIAWGLLWLLRVRNPETPIASWRTAFLLVGLVLACTLTPFVNPFGLEMLRTWQKIVGSEAMKEMVSEHQPLSLDHTAGQVIAGFAAFYLFALLGTLGKNGTQFRLPKVSWLIPLVWFALSLKGIRQGPLFVAVSVVALVDFWPETIWHRLLKKYGDSLAREAEATRRDWNWATIPLLLVLMAFSLQAKGIHLPVVGRGWAGLDPMMLPVGIEKALNFRHDSGTPRMRLFNDANLGGFVIYHVPNADVFMDDRFELYGDAWLRQYVDVVYDHPERFEEWVTRYRINTAFVAVLPDEHRLPLEKYLSESPRWRKIDSCERAALFLLKNPEN
jgi:hypothetical protein